MKKALIFLLTALIVIFLSACKNTSVHEGNSRNEDYETSNSMSEGKPENHNTVGSSLSYISASNQGTIAINEDGTVRYVGGDHHGQSDCREWKQICSVTSCEEDVIGVTAEGKILYAGRLLPDEILSWSDVVAASGSSYSEKLLCLHSDGTAEVAYGSEIAKQNRYEVDDWTDIVQVAAGAYHCVGLKSDGTVVAVGTNQYGQCDIDKWSDIVYVDAGWNCTVGIKSDKTLVIATENTTLLKYDFSSWTDLVAVAAHRDGVFALRADGTVLTTRDDCPDVLGWTDIIQISVSQRHVVGLRKNGTIVAANIESWVEQGSSSPWLDIADWNGIKTSG